MEISFLEIMILSLASFRLTRLIVFDKITEFLRAPFFDEVEEETEEGIVEVYYQPKNTPLKKFIGELLSCYWCTGIWATASLIIGFLLLPIWFEWVLLILAIAGLAAIIETFVQYLLDN